jgi:NADPH2:quinone reductase
VNPVDTYIRTGTYARKPALPYTPGSDAAGVVEAVGEGVLRVAAGARVYLAGSLTGSYAERALCAEAQVFPLPERVSFAQGAAVFVPYATAWRAVHQKAHAQPGERVLVHGASGGVGVAALQIGRAWGLALAGTAGTERGLAIARENGAAHAVDHTREDRYERLMELTGGRGFDVILEMLANVNLAADSRMLAPGGRVVVIGNRGAIEIDARELMRRDASVTGMSLFNASEPEMASLHAAIGAGLADGTLTPLTGRELPLGSAADAHRLVMEPGASGKIALIP